MVRPDIMLKYFRKRLNLPFLLALTHFHAMLGREDAKKIKLFFFSGRATKALPNPPPSSLVATFFFELQKSSFFFVARPLTPLPLSVAGALFLRLP